VFSGVFCLGVFHPLGEGVPFLFSAFWTQDKSKGMANPSRKHTHFRPTVFKIMATDDKLTAASGLATIMEVFDQSPLSQGFRNALPPRSANRSGGSYRLGLVCLNSMIYGHEALDDLEEFRDDPLLEAALKGEVAAPRTIGDFYRDFEPRNIDEMNRYLASMARSIRRQLIQVQPEEFRPRAALTIDIDSTSHVQSGEQMEGLAWNYKDEWCLDSQVAFDELGFCHGVQLRARNTRSGTNSPELIEQCFRDLKYEEEKFLRADSAYCFEEVFRTCMRLGVTYTITAHDGWTQWRSRIEEVSEWKPWIYSREDVEKAEKRKRLLPQTEVGRLHWSPTWAPNIRIPILVKRTWKEPEQLGMLTLPGEWHYYAVVTNHDLFHNDIQAIFEFHAKRGNAENFIREEKYGYDLKHFPCQKLRANHAYAQIAMVAHNILRWVALIQKPDKPHFSKKIRRRYIYIPGKVIMHARQLILKVPVRFYKEVTMMREALRYKPVTHSAFASGYA
jgi:hypothetical protein